MVEDMMPPPVKSLRDSLERARCKDPDAFDKKMSFADLKRLMASMRERFNVGEITHFGKKVGCDGPAAVLRRYCADLIKIKTSEQDKNKAHDKRRQVPQAEIYPAGPSEEPEPDIDFSDVSAPDDFFKKLPTDKMIHREHDLRRALFRWMQKQPDSLEPMFFDDASADSDVVSAAEKLLSRCAVPLQDWIERRLANDLGVGLDEHDRCVLLPLVPLDQAIAPRSGGNSEHPYDKENGKGSRPQNELFNRLPTLLTQAEHALAEKLSLFDGIPLSQAQNNVNSEKEAILTEAFGESTGTRKFPFKKWIEIRIIDYISLEPDSTGQPLIRSMGKHKRKMPADSRTFPDFRKRPRAEFPII